MIDMGRLFKSKKYMGRIFIWMIATMLVLISAFSIVNYLMVKRITIHNEYENSTKVLNQVKYNIDQVDMNIKNLCKSLYVNADVALLMYDDYYKDRDIQLVMDSKRLTNSIELLNPFIYSVTIYNSFINRYYNISSNMSLNFEDKEFQSIIAKYPNIPKIKPIFRKIELEYGPKDRYENAFTYVMYEHSSRTGKISGALAISVNARWLIDNIKEINMIKDGSDAKVFLIDSEGEFMVQSGSDEPFNKLLKEEYFKRSKESKALTGFFESSFL